MHNTRNNTLAWLIILGSFAIKIYYIFHFTHYADSVQFDMSAFWNGAIDRIDGKTKIITQYVIFPTYYIFFLAEFISVIKFTGFFAHALEITIFFQTLLYTLSAYVFYKMANHLISQKILVFCALLVYVFSYMALYTNALILPENLSIPLFVIATGDIILKRVLNKRHLISLGVILGVIVAAKPLLLFISIIFISYVGYQLFRKSQYLRILLFLAAFLIVPISVLVENYKISDGKLFGFGAYGGANFFAGWSHAGKIVSVSSIGTWWVCGTPFLDGTSPEPVVFNEPFYNQGVYYKKALEIIAQDPSVLLRKWLWFKNLFVGIFTPSHFVAQPPGHDQFMLATRIAHIIMFAGVVLLIFFLNKHPFRRAIFFLYFLLLSFTIGLYLTGFPERRYLYSVEFILIILFFISLKEILSFLKSQKIKENTKICISNAKTLMSPLINKPLLQTPGYLLVIVVYLIIFFYCLSYKHAWVQPEQLWYKRWTFQTGANLNLKDIKNGLSFERFEGAPRPTRPLSAYFEIADTKFRHWLWNYITPHPSLSLTWIFSLILAPLLLYLLLKNIGISKNVSLIMVAFYLSTPGSLSSQAMLFRPAKPMANFSIILCLYLASCLIKQKNRSFVKYLLFTTIAFFSFFWDETALLIFPAIIFIFPQILKSLSRAVLWFLLPFLVLFSYFKIIPYLSSLLGNSYPQLEKYDLFHSLHSFNIPNFISLFPINAQNLIFQTMGIFNYAKQAPILIKIEMMLALLAWFMVLYSLLRSKIKWDFKIISFLFILLILFNAMMYSTMQTWGPYYYGSFWSIFFTIFLAKLIEQSNIPKKILTICFFFIILSTINCFIGINSIYKKYHWYPYNPGSISDYFNYGKRLFHDPKDQSTFSNFDLKTHIISYWNRAKENKTVDQFFLPKELSWLIEEIPPTKTYYRYCPGIVSKNDFKKQFPNGEEIFENLVKKGFMVKYSNNQCFIREDINTTIQEGLKKEYPNQWKEILNILNEAMSKRPHFFRYSINLDTTSTDYLENAYSGAQNP